MIVLSVLERLKAAYHSKTLQYLGHEGTLQRLGRAMSILTTDTGYEIEVSEDIYLVSSVHLGLTGNREITVYEVDTIGKTCSCPDSEKGNICKHRIACEILEMIERD